jgi:hypothetical protein
MASVGRYDAASEPPWAKGRLRPRGGSSADLTAEMVSPPRSPERPGQTILPCGAVLAHARAATFIPIVGLFAGGAKGTISMITSASS